jgi:hypothetical protein
MVWCSLPFGLVYKSSFYCQCIKKRQEFYVFLPKKVSLGSNSLTWSLQAYMYFYDNSGLYMKLMSYEALGKIISEPDLCVLAIPRLELQLCMSGSKILGTN